MLVLVVFHPAIDHDADECATYAQFFSARLADSSVLGMLSYQRSNWHEGGFENGVGSPVEIAALYIRALNPQAGHQSYATQPRQLSFPVVGTPPGRRRHHRRHPRRLATRKDKSLGNTQAISHHAGPIPVFELPALPPADQPLDTWYDANAESFENLLGSLAARRAAGARELAGMKMRGRKALWWPFTQHDLLSDEDVNILDSAYGDYFCMAQVEGSGEEVRASCLCWW